MYKFHSDHCRYPQNKMKINYYVFLQKKTKKMKINYFVLLLVVSILTSSCATVLRSPKSHKVVTKISVTSNPPEANVYNKKGLVGSTPLTYNHKGRKTDVIYIKKEGYLDENAQIKRKINPVWTGVSLVTSIFPFPIAPLAVDHFTGHLYDIKTDSIHVDMVSKFGEKTSSNSDQSQVIKDEQKEQLNFAQQLLLVRR